MTTTEWYETWLKSVEALCPWCKQDIGFNNAHFCPTFANPKDWIMIQRKHPMIEIPPDQENTIYELAERAIVMTRAALCRACGLNSATVQGGQDSRVEQLEATLPASPVAAEIFKTLVRCHTQNKQQKVLDEAQAQLKTNLPSGRGPEVSSYYQGPMGPKI
jgi:hypothetical protein